MHHRVTETTEFHEFYTALLYHLGVLCASVVFISVCSVVVYSFRYVQGGSFRKKIHPVRDDSR